MWRGSWCSLADGRLKKRLEAEGGAWCGWSMTMRASACAAILLACTILGGCSSSFGSGGGGSSPSRTYVVLPNGQTAPVQTYNHPPGD